MSDRARLQPFEGRSARALPAIGALAYPGIIWCGPAVSPIFLVSGLIVPAVGLIVAHRAPRSFPRARAVGLLAVGVPALYSWLGGTLDFQQAMPVNGLGVWIPVWVALTVATLFERPQFVLPGTPGEPRTIGEAAEGLAFAHGLTALVVTAFAMAHLSNHLAGLWGGPVHIAVMARLRVVYRQPAVEAVLLSAVAFQFVSGAILAARKERRRTGWLDTLQSASGTYLACFFLSHLGAVLRARYLRGADTDWTWLTADSMLTDPWSARLAPYYVLGVIAFGVHAGLGLRHVAVARGASPAVGDGIVAAAAAGGVAAACLILGGLLTG